jgi:trimeric autotransporter adhesin
VVTYQGQVSNEFTVTGAASAPSLFTVNQEGWGQAAAINAADGTVNTATNPIRVGGYISLFATGEGQTSPAGVDGRLGGSTPTGPLLPVSVMVGGIPARVQYAGGVERQVGGLMQVSVMIPDGVQPGGYVPVVLRVGDRTSSPAVWIGVAGIPVGPAVQ